MFLSKFFLILMVIVVLVKFNKPLYISIGGAIVVALIIFQIPFSKYPSMIYNSIFGIDTIKMLIAFYAVTFLQRMLEKRNHLMIAENSISIIFNSRRVNAMIVPFVIGMLPSPGAILIAAPIVEKASEGYLDKAETTFATSYYRHISEAFLPTYPAIILALTLTGVSMSGFVLAMIPLVISLFLIGYFFYIRKIPKVEKNNNFIDYKKEWFKVARSLWSIILTISIILAFNLPVYYSVAIVIFLNFFIDKFSIKEIIPFFKTAFEPRLMITMIIIMLFKEVILNTGIVNILPTYFETSIISPLIIYALIFFIGTIIIGSQGIIATILPLIYSTLPNIGIGYFTLLMSLSYIAMQVSPTHICLGIITEYTGTNFDELVIKTIPVIITFTIIAIIYTYLLSILIG